MLAGRPHHFAFWYDVAESTGSFCYGPFNIFLNGKLLLSASESNFTLNVIASDLRRCYDSLGKLDELPPDFDPCAVFERALHTDGYHSYSDPVFPSHWFSETDERISALLDLFIEIEDSRRTIPPYGVELSMYSEISDTGWRFFLFSQGGNDMLLCSNDLGTTVLCHAFPEGEVKRAVEQFLTVEHLPYDVSAE
ncbi:Imm42 family immunity protein [Herbaspirillum aquaticum]|uniref:Imm42 family immunity protein n=1 Tax=Herbaspirillum aquaticum TaxID=568783 RepID=UPI0024DEABDA|nr:Imm42 family immunity protein [Herbaspirillum aquaticum]